MSRRRIRIFSRRRRNKVEHSPVMNSHSNPAINARSDASRAGWTSEGWSNFFRSRKSDSDRNESENSTTSLQSSGVQYKLSAAYVEDALAGRLYESGLARNLAEGRVFAVWCLHVTSHFLYSAGLILIVTFHCFLSGLEPTQMVAFSSKKLHPVAFWGGVSCCITYTLDFILNLVYCRPRLYFAFTHNRLYFLSIVLVSLDYILFISFGRMIFRPVRSFLMVFRVQPLRNTGLVMIGVTPKFLQFLLIMVAYVTVFAVIGAHVFMDSYIDNDSVKAQHDGIYEGAFNNTGIAVLEVFVLMTGGSYPRFMIPAYVQHGGAVLIYFITIIMTGEIILYAILVARIYDFYVKANTQHVKEERHRERQCLVKAFEILDEEGTGIVPYMHWKGLIKVLRPNCTAREIHKRFRKLKELSDKDKSNDAASDDFWTFDLYEFFYLPSVLQFIVERTKATQRLPNLSRDNRYFCNFIYHFGEWVTMMCRAWYHTRWAYIVSLTLNVMFVAPFALVWSGMPPEISRIAYFIEMVLLILISIEVIMQFIALGTSYILREMLLHVLMVLIAFVCMAYEGSKNIDEWNNGWIPVVAELAMVARLSGFKRKSSSMFHWLRRMAPPLFTLFCLTCVAFYAYGILGMECFGGLDSDNILPTGISLCRYGFETLGCSTLTLFQISLGSSWHKVMHFIMDEISDWTSIYFVLFYTFMQMLVLNVISAIMVELSNAIYHDEHEAKNRDKAAETRDDIMRNTDARNSRQPVFHPINAESSKKRGSSISTNAVLTAITMTTSLVTFDTSLFSTYRDECKASSVQSSPTKTDEHYFQRKASKDSLPRFQRQHRLPSIVEEDMDECESGDVTLTGRKELGKWTREIVPDMTFLNADDLRRLQEEMGMSAHKLKTSKRKNAKRLPSQSNEVSDIP